ncbi:sulfotransferase family 2 domain-containing protein [Tabrizicola flagellatus]|uniref:sulfotransferase family 2 domain-containing protein n=1 Tax=Tabrizicola flagellatus TaxID=2593021 RepID=UPI0011F226B4|nr:sulfotransferase family 2 domain-containing protein [Tabrizicola flagellatus]
MLVFWEQRLAFLATPKTGSTAIAAALESLAAVSIQRPPVLKHTTVHRFRRFVGPFLEAASKDSFTVVALMREPTDWLGSWYRFRQRDEADAGKSTRGMSFDEFVRAWCSDPRPDFADVGSQAKFLRPRQGVGVDRLFRYEEIDGFVRFLEDRLDCEITLPRLNVSPAGTTELTPATAALLREVAAEDFALYASLTG